MRSKFGIQRPLPWGNLPIRKDERFSCQSEWNRSNETWSFILGTIFGDSATSFHKENVGNAFEVQSFDRPLYYIRYMFIYLRRLLFDGRLQYTLFTIPTHSTSTNVLRDEWVVGKNWSAIIHDFGPCQEYLKSNLKNCFQINLNSLTHSLDVFLLDLFKVLNFYFVNSFYLVFLKF